MIIVIEGEPVGKGRPRFSTARGRVRTYTPEKTVAYENEIVAAYYKQEDRTFYSKGTNVGITIDAFFNIPKSTSMKKHAAMIGGEIRPTKKPDLDNIMKICCDALNGLVFDDDSQIVYGVVQKYYSDRPRVEIYIMEV